MVNRFKQIPFQTVVRALAVIFLLYTSGIGAMDAYVLMLQANANGSRNTVSINKNIPLTPRTHGRVVDYLCDGNHQDLGVAGLGRFTKEEATAGQLSVHRIARKITDPEAIREIVDVIKRNVSLNVRPKLNSVQQSMMDATFQTPLELSAVSTIDYVVTLVWIDQKKKRQEVAQVVDQKDFERLCMNS